MQILKKYQYLTIFFFSEKKYKYFIGYLQDNNKVNPLNVMLPKAIAYVKLHDKQTKWMYFLIEDDDLLEKYSAIRLALI